MLILCMNKLPRHLDPNSSTYKWVSFTSNMGINTLNTDIFLKQSC